MRYFFIFYLICLFGVSVFVGMSKYKELTASELIEEDNSPMCFLFAGTDKEGEHSLVAICDYRKMYWDETGFLEEKMGKHIRNMLFSINWPGAKVLKSKDTVNYEFYLKEEELNEITESINEQIERVRKEFVERYKAFGRQFEDEESYIELEILEDDAEEKKQKVFLRHMVFGTIRNFIYEAEVKKVVALRYGEITPDEAPYSRRVGLAVFVIGLVIYFALFIVPRWIYVKIQEIREAAVERID